jgi:hypothetical protein
VATAITVNGIPDLMHDDIDVRMGLEEVFGALWFSAEMARWTGRPFDRETVLDQMMVTVFHGIIELPEDETTSST